MSLPCYWKRFFWLNLGAKMASVLSFCLGTRLSCWFFKSAQNSSYLYRDFSVNSLKSQFYFIGDEECFIKRKVLPGKPSLWDGMVGWGGERGVILCYVSSGVPFVWQWCWLVELPPSPANPYAWESTQRRMTFTSPNKEVAHLTPRFSWSAVANRMLLNKSHGADDCLTKSAWLSLTLTHKLLPNIHQLPDVMKGMYAGWKGLCIRLKDTGLTLKYTGTFAQQRHPLPHLLCDCAWGWSNCSLRMRAPHRVRALCLDQLWEL